MSLFLVTAPEVEPVTAAEAKLHLRVDGSDEDELITALIVAAREYVENFTHRALIYQTWDLKLDGFPCWNEAIWLPKAPASSVTSVTYVDANGVTQTWSSSLYTTDFPTGVQARRGRIVPAYGQYFPDTRRVINAVTVQFVAGYGASGSAVPAGLKSAMKILIGTWFGPGRQGVQVGNIVNVIPQTVDSLLWPFKSF